jgi:ppGpp synthetase/RelA/SpoT-type nucleotidyltranferase
MELSKTQIDQLGERLKEGDITEADLRLLDAYRRSFTEAYEVVIIAIRAVFRLEPTGRPAKSTTSIADKLRRETIRLTQIQDIAGCRLTVSDIAEQEQVVQFLSTIFKDTLIVDRRQNPSHGYRAVHLIVRHQAKMVEVQVRTSLQHLWAELSEKLSDVFDPMLKYGEGNKFVKMLLSNTSLMVADLEAKERQISEAWERVLAHEDTNADWELIAATEGHIDAQRETMLTHIRDMIEQAESLKRRQ